MCDYHAVMKRLAVIAAALVLATAFAQDTDQRIADLEARVAQLEAMLTTPAPPPMNLEVDGFAFTRFQPRTSSIGLDIVGEVTADREYERVTFRATFYAADGTILETHTFSVEQVGNLPRTFDTGIFSDYTMDDVDTVAIQIEDIR
jgi:hypothetical protein